MVIKCKLCDRIFKDARGLSKHITFSEKRDWPKYKAEYPIIHLPETLETPAASSTQTPPVSDPATKSSGQEPSPAVSEAPESNYQRLQGEINALKELLLPLVSKNQDDDGVERVDIQEGTLVEKKILLTPKTLMLYDMTVRTGYQGELSSYINDSISKLYDMQGFTVGMIQRRAL